MKQELIKQYINNITLEMQTMNQWLLFKTFKTTDKNGNIKHKKIPYSATTFKADEWNKKENWTSFDNAISVLKKYEFDGLSFALSKDDPIVCIDLDTCIENNIISDLGSHAIDLFKDTYMELSQSKKVCISS